MAYGLKASSCDPLSQKCFLLAFKVLLSLWLYASINWSFSVNQVLNLTSICDTENLQIGTTDLSGSFIFPEWWVIFHCYLVN